MRTINYCECGCGEIVKGKTSLYLRGHYQKKKSQEGILTPWNKGVPRTEEEKKSIKKGISSESKKQNSERMKQRWKDGKYNILKGDGNPSKRPKVSAKIAEENKQQTSIRMKKDNPMFDKKVRDKVSKTLTGFHHSEKTKTKMSEAHMGLPSLMTPAQRKTTSERMINDNPMYKKEVIENHPMWKEGTKFCSKGEKLLQKYLKEMNVNFITQKHFARNSKHWYYADTFLPKYNVIIEYDGSQHHIDFPEKDKNRDDFIFSTYNILTLRIKRKEIYIKKFTISKIKEFLNETKTY